MAEQRGFGRWTATAVLQETTCNVVSATDFDVHKVGVCVICSQPVAQWNTKTLDKSYLAARGRRYSLDHPSWLAERASNAFIAK